MTGWSVLVYVCTPIPLILLTILTIPLPKSIQRQVLMATKGVIFFPLAGKLQLVHVLLCATAIAFLDQLHTTTELRGRERPMMQPDVQVLKGKVWRAERNLWIALFVFFVWWMLYAYYRTLLRFTEVKDENQRLKQQLRTEQRPEDKKND